MNLTTAEQLALAVLRGDKDAALPLADAVLEAHGGTSRGLVPVQRVTVERPRLRVAAYINELVNPPTAEDIAEWRRRVNAWLAGEAEDIIFFSGIDRIELYELPG